MNMIIININRYIIIWILKASTGGTSLDTSLGKSNSPNGVDWLESTMVIEKSLHVPRNIGLSNFTFLILLQNPKGTLNMLSVVRLTNFFSVIKSVSKSVRSETKKDWTTSSYVAFALQVGVDEFLLSPWIHNMKPAYN